MDRRRFLTLSTLGAATLPGWLAACSGRADTGHGDPHGGSASGDPPPQGADAVESALLAARAHGKPLLVFVVPTDASAGWARGQLFGTWINATDGRTLSPLALCEIACFVLSDLALHVPGLDGKDDTLAVLVETDESDWRATALDPRASKEIELAFDSLSDAWLPEPEASDQTFEHIDELARRIDELILPGEGALERRATRALARLAEHELPHVERGDPRVLPIDLVDRAAAALRRRAENDDRHSDAIHAALGAAAASRVREAAPVGAKWASYSGCGLDIEGEEDDGMAVACGMGHVPSVSQRFLYFYAQG